MAARIHRVEHSDEVRQRIQVSQLINRLQDHVFKEVEVSATQLKAIEVLLRKALPDLSQLQHTGKDGGDLVISLPERDARL